MKTKNLSANKLSEEFQSGFLAVCVMAICLLPTVNSFSQGTWTWAKQSHGVGNCNGSAADAFGNVYVTGSFDTNWSPTMTFGSTILTGTVSGAAYNFFIAKYDVSGNALWANGVNYAGASCSGWGVAPDASGNVYAAGTYGSGSNQPITFGSTTLPYAGNSDLFLVKYDVSGNVLWARGAGGTGGDVAYCAVADVSGNIYLAGLSTSPSITFGNNITLTTTGSGYFLAKYDASGNVLWAKNTSVYPFDMAADASGNVYIAGRGVAVSPGASFDGWLVKYDASGNLLWTSTSAQNWKAGFASVVVDPSGSAVYVTGTVHTIPSISTVSFGSITVPTYGFWDGFFVKYSASSGSAICALPIADLSAPGSANLEQSDVTVDPSGNVYVAGMAAVNQQVDFGPSTSIYVSGSYPMYIVVLDPNCNVICSDYLTEGAGGQLSTVYTSSDPLGNVYVAGVISANKTFNVGTTTLSSAVENDIWVGKYVKCGGSGCTATAVISSDPSSTVCVGQNVFISASGGITYSWNTGATTANIVAAPSVTTTYSVTLTDAAGCTGI
ncbi:MAG: hypothetical protein EPN85_03715, partial [Bacteroidetes bacterium]